MNIYSIYKATNLVNHKVYIGFDSKWPTRKTTHHRNLQTSQYEHLVFYKALRKYGWENFFWEVIYQSLDNNHCLNVMEPFFISEYKSYIWDQESNGYNMTRGGDGVLGFICDERTKELRRVNTKLYHDSLTPKEKNIRSANCSTGQKHRYMKRSDSEITKSRKSKSHQKKYLITSPTGKTFVAENGLKDFAEKNAKTLEVTYWQLFKALHRTVALDQHSTRKNKNKWKVIKLDII